MAAGQKAVESTAREEIPETEREEVLAADHAGRIHPKAVREDLTAEEKGGHSERILKEEASAATEKEGASAATDHAELSLKMEIEDLMAAVREDHTERIRKEEASAATEKEGASAATGLAELSLRTAKESLSATVREDLSQVKESLMATEGRTAVSETQERRVSIRRTSTTSAMKRKAESTR